MASPILASDPRRYSVEEMLSLKTSLPVVNCVIEKLNKHPDIAAIFRIPEEAFKDPERYYCQSQALVDVTNRRKVLQLSNRRAEASSGLHSSEESDAQVIPSSKLRNHTRSEQWQLRRRDSSHRSSEPHSAPSGVASQQSENFQRFYRAVVSPTHVRVTAGGRIVPNTRATAPPQFNWNPDKCLFEPRNKLADIELSTPQAQPLWLPDSSQPGAASPLLPAPLPNHNFLLQGNSLIQATMAARTLNEVHGNIQNTSENAHPPKEAANDPLQPANLPPIKISPPSQFDHSRPFVFNGQVVYPVPAGFQPPINSVPLPITVLGDPNLPHQIAPTGGFPPPPFPMPIPLGNFASPFMVPSGPIGHLPMLMPNGISHLEGGLPLGPYIPQSSAGTVSLSELTKFQIQGFRNQVKLIDDKLANNKRLVDEPFLQRQRSELMAFIEKIEAMLQTQLGQEGNITASNGRGSTETLGKSEISGVAEHKELSVSNSSLTSNEQLKKKGSAMVAQAMEPPIPLFVPTSQLPTTQTKSEGIQVTKGSVTSKPLTRSEPATKSKLTAAAAKAPPFQPRALNMKNRSESEPVSNIANLTPSDSILLPIPPAGLTARQTGPLGNRRTAYSSSDWGQPILHPGVGHASLARAHTMPISDGLNGNNSSLLQRSHTFHASASAYESTIRPERPLALSGPVPYLIGTVPHGMSISDAHGSGFVYSRPLTEDEIRARHLYWGNAPRSAMKGSGLPKFDGKDFYPPSPIKRMATPAATSNSQPKITTTHLPDFENLFTESGGPDYQSPAHSEQQLAPTPTRAFLGQNDIIGYESPSPRVATYSFENKVPANWSPRKWGININSILPQAAHSAAPEPANPVSDDFSTLFTSPTSPQHNNSDQDFGDEGLGQPTTPKNGVLDGSAKDEDNEPRTVDSWGASKNVENWNREDREENTSTKTNTNYSQSNASTVEIRLTPNDKNEAPERDFGSSFSEQLAMASGKDTQFLQNMLRATAAASMAAPAFSSATAVGYLPQYRGTAAASLAPAMFSSMKALEREDEITGGKTDQVDLTGEGVLKVSTEGVAPLIAANFLPEDRPINRDRPRKPIRASVETMGAEGYMRYLSQKAEADKKILEQGWNPYTTGTGPVMGSDW